MSNCLQNSSLELRLSLNVAKTAGQEQHLSQMLKWISAMLLNILITYLTAHLVTKWVASRLTRWWGVLIAIAVGSVVGTALPLIFYILFFAVNQIAPLSLLMALFASCISGLVTARKNRRNPLGATRTPNTASSQEYLQDARRRVEEIRYRN